MTTPVTTLLADVSKCLKDEVNWIFDLTTELLPLLNMAVPAIVNEDPLAAPVDIPFLTTPGIVQTIPGDAVALIMVRGNCGALSTDYGDAITEMTLDSMNAARRGWRRDVMGSGLPGVPMFPFHWIPSARGPRFFDLWPAVAGTWYVDIQYAAVPDNVAIGDNFPLPDMYLGPAYSWIVAKALAGRRPQLDAKGEKLIEYHTAEFYKQTGSGDVAKKQTVPNATVQRP